MSELRTFKRDVKRMMKIAEDRGWNRMYFLMMCKAMTKLLEATLGVPIESKEHGSSDNQDSTRATEAV